VCGGGSPSRILLTSPGGWEETAGCESSVVGAIGARALPEKKALVALPGSGPPSRAVSKKLLTATPQSRLTLLVCVRVVAFRDRYHLHEGSVRIDFTLKLRAEIVGCHGTRGLDPCHTFLKSYLHTAKYCSA